MAHLASLLDEEAILAYKADGEPLAPQHGWAPATRDPQALFLEARRVAAGTELLDHDGPGFWERLGYHNDADYWKEERYGF